LGIKPKWTDPEFFRGHEDKVLLFLTLVIGAVVGLVVVAFIVVTENLGARMYPAGGAAWRRLVIPVAGSLLGGFLLFRYFPNARGSGIPQTKAALFIHGGVIRFKTAVGKFVCSSISLASGIALGREGPAVHVGAGIASTLGRRLGLSPKRVKDLVPIGASAALAAAFNTPIAAVLFTLEEVMGDLHAPVLGSIVLSSATSWMVLHLLLGDEPLFHVPAYQLVHPLEFGLYALLGLAGGLLSVAFVKLLLWQRKTFLRLPVSTRWFQPGVGGLVVGMLGWFIPEVLGVGYSHVSQALNGQMAIRVMAMLVVLKLVATATCYSSGNAGGIFGPSLFLGAMLGGAMGGTAHSLLPDYTGSVGAYALVGMGTAFAGIIRVPLTSVIMIFEITRDYSIIVPLMISNLISYFISSRLQPDPIYEALQHQDGIHLPAGAREREELLLVGEGVHPPAEVLSATETTAAAVGRVHRDQQAWPVVDGGRLLGMLDLQHLESAVEEGRGAQPVATLLQPFEPRARLTAENFPHVHADHPLDTAMRRMAMAGLTALPVVSRANMRELQGVISLQDVLAVYGLEKGSGRVAEVARPETPSPIVGIRGVAAAVVLAVALIGFLSYAYRSGRTARVEEYTRQGDELLRRERYEEAVEKYRNALSISHAGAQRLALAEALRKAGRLEEARIYFRELQRDDPAGGQAYLGLARIAAAEKNVDEAAAEYHRAIAGAWNTDAEQNRLQARFELIELLGSSGRVQQARDELRDLLQHMPSAIDSQLRVGDLLLRYGMSREAVALFLRIENQDRQNAKAYAGQAEAELALGDLVAAHSALRQAVRLDSGEEGYRRRLAFTEQVLAVDPAIRGLPASERYRRSRKLMESALGSLDQCLAGKISATPEDVRNLADDARKALLQHRAPRSFIEGADANVERAAKLWQVRIRLCGAPADSESALALAIKLAQ
jgi:CIC family chloride channel protein